VGHDTCFQAAYILLLSRVWQELESTLSVLLSTRYHSLQSLELRCEILRLELVLLRDSLESPRLPMQMSERTRVRVIVDRLLTELTPHPLAGFAGRVRSAQDLLFDEIQGFVVPVESRVQTAAA
jgi:hypothetical protein